MKAIEELGYYPYELARSLSRKQTTTIGLIFPGLSNPVYAEIAKNLESVCTAEGYIVMLCSTGRDSFKEKQLAEVLRAKQIDGAVIIPSSRRKKSSNHFGKPTFPRLCWNTTYRTPTASLSTICAVAVKPPNICWSWGTVASG